METSRIDSRSEDIVRHMTQTLAPFPPSDADDAAAYALQGIADGKEGR